MITSFDQSLNIPDSDANRSDDNNVVNEHDNLHRRVDVDRGADVIDNPVERADCVINVATNPHRFGCTVVCAVLYDEISTAAFNCDSSNCRICS